MTDPGDDGRGSGRESVPYGGPSPVTGGAPVEGVHEAVPPTVRVGLVLPRLPRLGLPRVVTEPLTGGGVLGKRVGTGNLRPNPLSLHGPRRLSVNGCKTPGPGVHLGLDIWVRGSPIPYEGRPIGREVYSWSLTLHRLLFVTVSLYPGTTTPSCLGERLS